MELGMRNELQQKQVLSQKMIQSVRILEMGVDEMEAFLNDMAENNPMIDLERDLTDYKKDLKCRLEWERQNDYQNAPYYSSSSEQGDKDEYMSVNAGATLEEYLMLQLIPLCKGKYKKNVFYYLVKSLNGWGYLDADFACLADEMDLSLEELKEYLLMLQSCEPAGVGARDMRECLLIQLMRYYPKEQLAMQIVEKCLEFLGKQKLQAISKQLEKPVEEIKAAMKIIYQLNPKPANGFSNQEHLQYIYPDVFVMQRLEQMETVVNESSVSRIHVNPFYLKLLEDASAERETVEYIKSKLEQAKWAVHCIEQRKTTLQNVAETIVNWQRAFFSEGGGLVPMRLADISKETALHSSTVSRAVKNKYLQCSRGIYPMSYFFVGTIGDNTPSDAKDMIRDIIEKEDKKKPKSDQKIAELLEKKGFQISRRTVAKYRSEMGIAEAGGRKEY